MKSFKKLARISLIGLIIIIVMWTFAGCKNEAEKDLYDFKTKYVGDNSKVGNIVSNIEFNEDYNFEKIKIMSEEKPYGLIIYLSEEIKKEDQYEFELDSLMIFSLIENLEYIKFSNEKETDEFEIYRNRADGIAISVLGMRTEEIGSSKRKFKELEAFYYESKEEIINNY